MCEERHFVGPVPLHRRAAAMAASVAACRTGCRRTRGAPAWALRLRRRARRASACEWQRCPGRLRRSRRTGIEGLGGLARLPGRLRDHRDAVREWRRRRRRRAASAPHRDRNRAVRETTQRARRSAAYSIPGRLTSMPNTAEPSVFGGVSLRGVARPISVKFAGSFRRGCVGTGLRCREGGRFAIAHGAPGGRMRDARGRRCAFLPPARPRRGCGRDQHLARGGTEALRSRSKYSMVESLLAVRWRLVIGLRKASSAYARRTSTSDQSASSSSARIFGRPSWTPCPISDCGQTTITRFHRGDLHICGEMPRSERHRRPRCHGGAGQRLRFVCAQAAAADQEATGARQ